MPTKEFSTKDLIKICDAWKKAAKAWESHEITCMYGADENDEECSRSLAIKLMRAARKLERESNEDHNHSGNT